MCTPFNSVITLITDGLLNEPIIVTDETEYQKYYNEFITLFSSNELENIKNEGYSYFSQYKYDSSIFSVKPWILNPLLNNKYVLIDYDHESSIICGEFWATGIVFTALQDIPIMKRGQSLYYSRYYLINENNVLSLTSTSKLPQDPTSSDRQTYSFSYIHRIISSNHQGMLHGTGLIENSQVSTRATITLY